MADQPAPAPAQILKEDDYVFVPLAEATSPAQQGAYWHYVDSWWLYHPEKGLAFWNPKRRDGRRRSRGQGAPQCNTNEKITRHLFATVPRDWLCDVIFVPSAWGRLDLSDYQY